MWLDRLFVSLMVSWADWELEIWYVCQLCNFCDFSNGLEILIFFTSKSITLNPGCIIVAFGVDNTAVDIFVYMAF